MASAVQLYEALAMAPDDKTRAAPWPYTTRAYLRETEFRLRKEIGQARSDLKVEIKQPRSEFKTEIEQFRSELKSEIANIKLDLIKWIVPMMFA